MMVESEFHPACLIPAYQCEATIGAVVEGVRAQGLEALVVDDGSTDGTGERARGAGGKVLRRASNGGKGAAIREGLARILQDPPTTHVLFLDGDGQHDPADIPKLVAAGRRGERFVVGSRMQEKNSMPAYRRETNRIGGMILSRMTGLSVEDSQSGFRLVEATLLRELRLTSDGYLIDTEILLKCAAGLDRICWVPVRVIYGGPSHYRPFRDTWKISWGAVYLKVFETEP
jgi:glycosyltransferase involved in cell wall biosynthesis